MPPSRHIRLTEEEDAQLREIEQDPYLKPKVRLRAQVLRLSNRGSKGLADGAAPGNPPRITRRMEAFMEEKLSEEKERTWNATQLAEVLKEEFGLEVSPEAVRQHLVSMGYSWKRTRYVPNKAPDPEAEREAREELEALKRGRQRQRSP